MIKRILIPLDPSPYTDKAIDVGCTIARQSGAELSGLVVLDLPGIEKSIGSIPVGGGYYAEQLEMKKQKDASEHIQALLTKFEEKCEQEGVRHSEAQRQGSPSEYIIKEAYFYDAVMVGLRTFFHFETSDKPGNSLDDLLDHCVTPIYGVPKDFQLPNIPEEKVNVVIALNDSPSAIRALHRFGQLAANAPTLMEVVLVISDKDEKTANYYLNQAEAYLKSHSIPDPDIEKVWTKDNIIDAINDKYLDWATIVVAGVHSKKGWFDFNSGDLIKFLIKEDKKPILIGQ